MFLLWLIIVFAGYAAAILGAVLLVMTLICGVLVLFTKDKTARAKRKNSFFFLLKFFLIVLCVVVCMAVLVEVLGSQVTFSM